MADNSPSPVIEPTSTKVVPSQPTPLQAPLPAGTPEITLEQFGVELSQRDQRVELLNGFIFMERKAGHFKDAESNYQDRYTAFLNKPV